MDGSHSRHSATKWRFQLHLTHGQTSSVKWSVLPSSRATPRISIWFFLTTQTGLCLKPSHSLLSLPFSMESKSLESNHFLRKGWVFAGQQKLPVNAYPHRHFPTTSDVQVLNPVRYCGYGRYWKTRTEIRTVSTQSCCLRYFLRFSGAFHTDTRLIFH